MEKKRSLHFNFTTCLLWTAFGLSLVHLVFLLLGLFNVLTPSWLTRKTFNYVVAFILVGLCLVFYICLMLIEKRGKLLIPTWFKIVLYIGFYVFTNVYYYFGLYGELAGLIIFYLYLGLVLNIISLALFFNTQKTENNVLKATTTFTVVTTFCYSVAGGALIETIISALKLLISTDSIFSSLSMFIIDMCLMVLVSILFAIAFSLSLSKSKTLINNCLIKHYK